MNQEIDLAFAARRRRRRRGWIEVGGGLALIAASVLLTWLTFAAAIKHGGGTYLVWDGGAAVGFLLCIRGLLRLLRVDDDALAMRGKSRRRAAPVMVAVGFKSFVGWRYLMARDHRISRPILVVFLSAVFLFLMGVVLEHSLIRKGSTLDPALIKVIKQTIAGMEIGGVVLVFGTVIVAGLRYVFSFFTTVPLVGVWIGTAALVCVLSVMSGFETDLREKILGSNAHIQITKEEGDFTEWREVKARIDKLPGVVASSPYAVSEVVIAAQNNGMNVIIKGIDPATVGKVTDLVKDIDDFDKLGAMKRLEPLVNDNQDLVVPPAPTPSGQVVDPPPADMPTRGAPIDFSQPTGEADEAVDSHEPPPLAKQPHDAGAPDDFGGDAKQVVENHENVVDPPPSDMLTPDEPPIDYSGEDSEAIQAIDVPLEQDSTSRRTQSLPGILVGKELVKQTHLYTGEEVRVVSPLSDPANPDATGTPIPFNRDYRVAGVFFTGMYEYDLKYVYVTLDSLTEFLDRGDVVDGIEVRVSSPDDTDEYARRLSTLLGKQYSVKDWKELNRSLFSALKLEKIAMFLVLGIVILVASFSIVGNLIMVVVEKGREIALLKTLGASDVTVMSIFAIQGLLIGIIGTMLGVGTGLVACYLGKHYGIPLNPDVYYIDRMPVHVDPSSVVITALAGVLISMAATFYPALVAARVRPAAGMRH